MLNKCQVCKEIRELSWNCVLGFTTREERKDLHVCDDCYDEIESGQIILQDNEVYKVKSRERIDESGYLKITWEKVEIEENEAPLNREAMHQQLDALLDAMECLEHDTGVLTLSVTSRTVLDVDTELAYRNTYSAEVIQLTNGELQVEYRQAEINMELDGEVSTEVYEIITDGDEPVQILKK
jgi:hypothetical protein